MPSRVLTSSIGTKLLVGITGLALVLYLVIHIVGNAVVFLGPDAFNRYAYTLESLPIIPIIESCISPRYHEDVSPESAMPTVPSSAVIFSSTLSIAVMRVLGMISGFFIGVETGISSTLTIFIGTSS